MVGSLTLNSDTELQTGEGEKKFKKKDSLGFKLITQTDGDTKVNFFKVLSFLSPHSVHQNPKKPLMIMFSLMCKCMLNSGSTVLNSNASVNIHIMDVFIK